MMSAVEDAKVDMLIRGGTIAADTGVFPGSVAVRNGRIVALLAPDTTVEAEDVIDVKGCVIMPGVIDAHVHLWEPGPYSYREDFLHGTRAAAAGGVTTIIEMPLSVPPIIDGKSFALKLKTAKAASVVDFALWGALIPACIGNLRELHDLGCVGFKGFMSYANDEYPHMPDHYLLEAMERAAEFDGLIAVHAENADIVDYTSKIVKENGKFYAEAHADGRPEFAELEAVLRAILFAQQTRSRLHIVHLSIADGAEAVRNAKMRGVRVTAETCPHYLALDRTELSKRGPFVKCNPPLRKRDTVEALWRYVFDGTIDFIASDHGPYSNEEKLKGIDNIWEAPPGFAGLETMLPVMIDEGIHKRGLTISALARLTAANVARTFRLSPKKGSISIGSDADLAVVDLNQEWTVDGAQTFSRTHSQDGPFHGRKIRGKVIATIVRGKVVYQEGQILAEPGFGEYVPTNR